MTLTEHMRRGRAAITLGSHLISGGRRGSVRRVRSAVIGIGLSLVPLVLVLQVADGMIRGIADRYIETSSYHLQARPRFGAEEGGYQRVAETISQMEGVRFALTERQGLGLAYSGAGRAGATIRAVSPDLWERDERLRELISVDSGAFEVTGRGAVLGRDMARRLDLVPGDRLRLLTVRSGGGGRYLPRVTTVDVTGIVSTGYQDLDRLWVFIDLDLGSRILPAESSRSTVGIKIDDPYGLPNPLFSGDGSGEATMEAIRRQVPANWQVESWYDIERTQYLSFVATRNLLIFVMFLIVCVASVNIASTLSTLSIEKREELAILKSTGSSSRALMTAFLSAGFIIGVVGTLLGLATGLLLAVNVNELIAASEFTINSLVRWRDLLLEPFGISAIGSVDVISTEFYLERIPIDINLPSTLAACLLAVLVATFSALLPAYRASRVRPLEVLRRH